MKWIRSRNKFLEAKIIDVVFPRQAKEIKSIWGEKYLEYEEITPTDNIKQGLWKLSEEDKRIVLGKFFQCNMDEIYKIFESLPEKFAEVLKASIDTKLLNEVQNNRWGGVLSNFNVKIPSIDEIYLLYENVFRKLSVNETLADEVIQRDETGKPVLGEDNKPLKVKKKKGEPVFSNNLVNINSFVSDYNRCYPKDSVVTHNFTDGEVYKIRNSAAQDYSGNRYEIDFEIFTKDMYLSIIHNPKDILNMSISKFYTSCQHLYDGGYRSYVIGNVFDPNSIPAYLKFDIPIKEDGEVISDHLPISRMMVRNIESFSQKFDEPQIYHDRCYPDRLKNVMSDMITKYSGNKPTTNSDNGYLFTPDIDPNDSINDPYMDTLSLKRGKLIGVNAKNIYLTLSQDWSNTIISPRANIKELTIETTKLPSNIFDLPFILDWIKFKYIQINSLKDFKFQTNSVSLDKCKFNNKLLNEMVTDFPHIKRLHIESCNIKNINLAKFGTLDELGLIYTLPSGGSIEKALGGIKVKKLIISGDLLSNVENKEFIKKLKNSKVRVEIVGLVI